MLTDKQQKFAEENHRLIFGFLHKYSLSCDEWYGVAAIGFCKAVAHFDSERGIAFPVFAYHVTLNDVRMEKRKSRALARNAPVVSLQDELREGFTIEETLAYEPCFLESFMQEDIMRFIGSLKTKHRLLLALCATGKTQKEISDMVGLSQSYVSRNIKMLKKRFSEFQQTYNKITQQIGWCYMSLNQKFTDERNKIDKLCDDNNLEFTFVPGTFPLVMSVAHSLERRQQMSLIESEKSSYGARIDFIFSDDLVVKVVGNFSIDDEVLNKIKNGAKKLHYLFLQEWFKTESKKGKGGEPK